MMRFTILTEPRFTVLFIAMEGNRLNFIYAYVRILDK